MTPTTQETSKVQRQVFDLAAFDSIQLVKTITLPSKPGSLEDALTAVGNDRDKLLNVIHEGLKAEARDAAYEDIEGFLVVGEDGEPGEPYTGKYAAGEKAKLINNAILSLAKINGYDKSLSKEKRAELKEKATAFLRDNPAMLASLQS